MAEPELTHCGNCGKGIIAGLIEDVLEMKLDLAEVPYEDALVLERYRIVMAQVRLRALNGKVWVTYSRLFHGATEQGDWVTLMPHICTVTRDRIGEGA
jgi:hypothetical protein